MSYGEHVLLAEVVVEQKAANCTQGRCFYEHFYVYYYFDMLWRTFS